MTVNLSAIVWVEVPTPETTRAAPITERRRNRRGQVKVRRCTAPTRWDRRLLIEGTALGMVIRANGGADSPPRSPPGHHSTAEGGGRRRRRS